MTKVLPSLYAALAVGLALGVAYLASLLPSLTPLAATGASVGMLLLSAGVFVAVIAGCLAERSLATPR